MTGSTSMRKMRMAVSLLAVLASLLCATMLFTHVAHADVDQATQPVALAGQQQKATNPGEQGSPEAGDQQATNSEQTTGNAEQASGTTTDVATPQTPAKPAAPKTEAQKMDALAAANKLENGTYSDGLVNNGIYLINYTKSKNKVVEGIAASKKNKANAATATSSMAKSQQWKVVRDAKGYVSFINVASGKALTIDGDKTKSGTNVSQATYKSSKRSQKWVVVSESKASKLMSALGKNLCLGIAKGSTKNGANVRIETSKSTDAQRFSLMRVGAAQAAPQQKLSSIDKSAWYEIAADTPGSIVFDIAGASTSNGANAGLWNKNGNLCQLFNFSFVKTAGKLGFYRIIAGNSGKVLQIANGNLVKGTNVVIGKKSNAASQLWAITQSADGSFKLKNAASNFALGVSAVKAGGNVKIDAKASALKLVERKNLITNAFYTLRAASNKKQVVDISGASKSAGADALMWNYAGGFNQKWRIAAVKKKTNTYVIESIGSGKVLTAASAATGAAVKQQVLTGTDLQYWTPEIMTDGSVIFTSVANPGLSLSMTKGKTKNGTKVTLAKGTAKSHRFCVTTTSPFEGGVFYAQLASNPLVVAEVVKASFNNGAKTGLWTKTSGETQSHQKWIFRDAGNGAWRIINARSCKALAVNKGTAKKGASIIQADKSDAKSQQWKIEYVEGTGGFKIVSALSDSLSIQAKAGKAGARLVLGKSSKNADKVALQSFGFEKTEPYSGTQLRMFNFAQRQSSKTRYLILVWRDSCKVAIFEGSKNNWDYVKYVPCGPGTDATPTTPGRFEVGHKKPCLPSVPVARYCTQIFLDMYFHSVLYSTTELGHKVSHGCIRMNWPDAKWIYDRIPSGTKVMID